MDVTADQWKEKLGISLRENLLAQGMTSHRRIRLVQIRRHNKSIHPLLHQNVRCLGANGVVTLSFPCETGIGTSSCLRSEAIPSILYRSITWVDGDEPL